MVGVDWEGYCEIGKMKEEEGEGREWKVNWKARL